MSGEQLRQQIENLLLIGKYDEVKPRLLSYKDITEHDNDLATVCYLCTIYEQEKRAGQETLFSKVSGVNKLLERYTLLKFYLRRIEFDIMDDMELFYLFLAQSRISSYEMMCTIDFSVVHKEKVLQAIGNGVETRKTAGKKEQKADMADDADALEDMRQFCFILCTNNPMYAEECICYINHLNVPKGIGIEVLTVEEANLNVRI